MALPSSGQLSVNTIHGHILTSSSNAYEGGYALRAMSLHGRWKLNNSVFDIEDRISDFYGKDFYWQKSQRNISMVYGGYGSQYASIETICQGPQRTTNIYVTAYDYFTNYLNGLPTTFFSDVNITVTIQLRKLWDVSRDWIWETNGVGIGSRINTDCEPYQEPATINYYGEDRCNRGSTYVVASECALQTGRYYQVCKDNTCLQNPGAPCEIYITGIAPSQFAPSIHVTNCSATGCGFTICADDDEPFEPGGPGEEDNPFLKK